MLWKYIRKCISGSEKSHQEIMAEYRQQEEEWKTRLDEVQTDLNRSFLESGRVDKHLTQLAVMMAQLRGERHLKAVK